MGYKNLNGVYQFKNTYTLNGTTLTLDAAPANGVAIEVMSIGSAYSGGDILYDHDFGSAGLMTTNGSGVYSITANNSSNWNTAYTYSQVGHLPLAGGTVTGDVTMQGGRIYVKESDLGNTAIALTRDVDEGYVQLFSSGTQTIEIRGNGNTYFNGGAVGIGLTNPAVKLEIQDSTHTTMKIRSGNNDNILFAQALQSDEARICTDTNSAISFFTNTSRRMTITTSGNVGIGTNLPDGNLEVIASTTVSGASDSVNNVLIGLQAANRPTIILDTADTTHTNRTWNITNVGSAGSLFFGRNGLDVLVMKNDGKVGIGTTSPGTKLQVKDSQDSSFDSGISVIRSASSQTGYINMVGGAFNFNAPSGVPIKFRDGGTTNVILHHISLQGKWLKTLKNCGYISHGNLRIHNNISLNKNAYRKRNKV